MNRDTLPDAAVGTPRESARLSSADRHSTPTASIDFATLTGLVDLTAIDPQLINLRAMCHGLSQLNRWAGATLLPISVAQHSRLVYEIFLRLFPDSRRHAVHAALHDGHEYLLTDITSPIERLIDRQFPGFSRWLAYRKNEVDIAIRARFGLPEPDMDIRARVHDADMVAADLEWRLLIPPDCGPSPFAAMAAKHPPIAIRAIRPLPPPEAADALREILTREIEERAWE